MGRFWKTVDDGLTSQQKLLRTTGRIDVGERQIVLLFCSQNRTHHILLFAGKDGFAYPIFAAEKMSASFSANLRDRLSLTDHLL
jgi:hypothetical protein